MPASSAARMLLRIDFEDPRVAVGVVGEDPGLPAGHRLRRRAQRGQQFGEDRAPRSSRRRPAADRDSGRRAPGRSSPSSVSVAYGSGARPIALSTTTTGAPPRAASSTREAAISRSSGVESDEPPNFWTMTRSSTRRGLGEPPLLDQQLEDLHAVRRRAFAQLIADDPHHEAPRRPRPSRDAAARRARRRCPRRRAA